MTGTDRNFAELVRNKVNRQNRGVEEYKTKSRERLESIASKKITTTMIGSLESIEKNFGFLWEGDSHECIELKDIFEKVRNEILDKGNNQVRNLREELSQYEVKWLRYHVQLPVKPLGRNRDEE